MHDNLSSTTPRQSSADDPSMVAAETPGVSARHLKALGLLLVFFQECLGSHEVRQTGFQRRIRSR